MKNLIKLLNKHNSEYLKLIEFDNDVKSKLIQFYNLIKTTKLKKKKLIIAGNGGSAAIASHFSVDITKNANTRCINFNESDLLTCFSNDYGYENWTKKALNFFADKGDLIILISASGKSKNILNAAKFAKKNKNKVITFSGFQTSNPLRKLGNINFYVNSKQYNHIENTHQYWLLTTVDLLIGSK